MQKFKSARLLILLACVISFSNCEQKLVMKTCKYNHLCDTNLYFSFTIDTVHYKLEQNYNFYLRSYVLVNTIDTTYVGFVVGNGIRIEGADDLNINDLFLSKEFDIDDKECDLNLHVSNEAGDTSYSVKRISETGFASIYADTLQPSLFFQKTDTVLDEYIDESLNITKSWYIFGGFNLDITYDDQDYNSSGIYFGDDGNYWKKGYSGSSYFVVNKMEHYYDDIYIIEGVFDITLLPIAGLNTIRLKNGSFKLAVVNTKDYISNYPYYYWK